MNKTVMLLLKCASLMCAIIVILLALAPSSSFARDDNSSWETMLYKDEPFIRLLKEIVVKIDNNYSETETTHIIDKVQNDGGKKLGEIPILYDQSRQDIKDIEAYTVMPDGSRIRADRIQDVNIPQSFGVYNDLRVKIVTMPNLTDGCTIDYKWTIVTRKPAIEKNFYGSFRFTDNYPIRLARYKLIIPSGIRMNIKPLNIAIEPKVTRSGNDVIYTWETRNNDKVEVEEYMPGSLEVDKRITVSTVDTWYQFSEWAWSLYRKNIKVSPLMKDAVKKIIEGKTTEIDKINAVIEYIQREFRYVAMHIELHGYEPHSTDEIFLNKYGDCKDQTLVAIALLSEIGVKAWPALFSTWTSIERTDILPMPVYFDHVILAVEHDGKTYFSDLLIKGYQLTEIPRVLSGKRVFVVNDRGGYFSIVPETDKAESMTVRYEQAYVREDGSAQMRSHTVYSRSTSMLLKDKYRGLSMSEKRSVLAAIEAAILSGGKSLESRWDNIDLLHGRISLNLKFDHPSLAQKVGDMLLFGIPPAVRGAIFTAPQRTHPMVSNSTGIDEVNYVFAIPEGYEIISLPKSVSLSSGIAEYNRSYAADNDKVTAKESFKFLKARIPTAEYRKVQDFLDEIPRRTNDRIVIRKKPSSKSIADGSGAASVDNIFSKVSGTWEWKDRIGTERSNPHTIGFVNNNQQAVFTYERTSKRAGDRISNSSTYKVISHDATSITMALDGETRKTDSGELVVWTLVLKNHDVYCWRRTDWKATSCTKQIQLLFK